MSEKPFTMDEFLKRKQQLSQNKAIRELAGMGMAKERVEYVTSPEGQPNPISKESPNIVNQGRQTAAQIVDAVQPKVSNQEVMQVAASQAPDQVKTIVDNMSASESVRFQVKKLIDNPQALAQQQARIDSQKAEGKPMGMVDQFVDGLQFFMPTALGALVGAIGGGSAAAVEGAEMGNKLGQSYRDFKGQNFDRALKAKQVDADIAAQQLASGINAMNADLRAQELSNTEKRIAMEMKRENRLQSQGMQQLGLRAQAQNLNEMKAGQLSDKQAEDISSLYDTQDQLRSFNLDALKTTGPIEGRIRNLAESFGLEQNADFIELKAGIGSTLSNYMKSISGAAVNENEAKRLTAILPSVKDNDEQFITKLTRFQNELDAKLNNKINAISAGQELKAKTVERFRAPKKEEAKQQETTDRVNNLFTRLRK